MKRIILSSNSLYREFHILLATNTDDAIQVECNGKKLQFEGLESCVDVEARSEWVVTLPRYKIKSLLAVVKSIQDQPLVLTFENKHGDIQIDNLLI